MELTSPERRERIALMRQQKAEREKAEQRASELAELEQLMREEAEFAAARGGGGVRGVASTSLECPSASASESASSTTAAVARGTATPSPASNHVRLRDNEADTLTKDAPPPKKRDKRLIDLMHLEMSR